MRCRARLLDADADNLGSRLAAAFQDLLVGSAATLLRDIPLCRTLPHLAQLRLERIWLKAGQVRIAAATTCGEAECPGCGVASARVHSRYQRRLVDSAIGGREVLVTLRVRRFFCDQPDCAKGTFAEQVEGLTARYGRRTAPAEQAVQAVAMALGGRAGARLVDQVAVQVSRSTLLRVVRRAGPAGRDAAGAGS